ncbi:hypothetical protein RP20_CCG004397 [Aedes albopictus]|nr:hypothetical protein RP20_CCG004397 [Aedes albopictus]
MAPERIDPQGNPGEYNIKSDVWSLGISMIEMATGTFPYSSWGSPFEQLKQVVKDDPPRLKSDDFTEVFKNFIIACLQKKYQDRYNYDQLLNHPFIQEHTEKTTDVASFVSEILDLAATV